MSHTVWLCGHLRFFFHFSSRLIFFYKIRALKMNFFGVKEFFYMNLYLKNSCRNEFKDNNEKSCSWSGNSVSRKIDFKVQWLHNSHADSVVLNMSTDKMFDLFLERLLSFRFRLLLGGDFFCPLLNRSFFKGSLFVIMVETFSSESELLSDFILCSILRWASTRSIRFGRK